MYNTIFFKTFYFISTLSYNCFS